MTLTVLNCISVFTRPDTVNILFDSFGFMMNEGMNVYAYVILENHLHLIAQSGQLDKDIARFKSFTARRLISYLQTNRVHTILKELDAHKKPTNMIGLINSGRKGVIQN